MYANATAPSNTLLEWIRKRKADLTPAGTITKIELWHAIDGIEAEPLSTFDITARPEDEDPDDLAQEIWNEAYEDAGTRPQGSHQRYVVRAFRGEQSALPEESKAFIVQGAAVSSMIGSGSDSPTPRGMMAQEMRHTDNLHALVVRMCEGVAGQMASQLREAREDNTRLYNERRQLYELEQKMLDKTHEREMDRTDRERSAQRVDSLMTMASTLLPIIASKFLQGPPAPAMMAGPGAHASHPNPAPSARVAAVMARDVAIGNVLESLRPEQIKGLFDLLSEEQKLAFMELYGSYRQERESSPSTTSESENPNVQEH